MAEFLTILIFLFIGAWIKSHDNKKIKEKNAKMRKLIEWEYEFLKRPFVFSEDGHLLGLKTNMDAVEKERLRWEETKGKQ